MLTLLRVGLFAFQIRLQTFSLTLNLILSHRKGFLPFDIKGHIEL